MTKQRKALLVVAALALAGMFVMLRATRFGIGVLPDSTIYFDAARNLGNGHGLVVISGTNVEVVPLTHYPPLYPLLLALATTAGLTIESAARWLNATLFAVNIFLAGLSIAFYARNSFCLPLTGAFLTLSAPDLLAYHAVALTEPLYLALTLGGLISLAVYLQVERRWFLFASAILIALSALTRFVGVAGIGTGVVALLLLDRRENAGVRFAFTFRGGTLQRRISDTLIFVAASCTPIALWSIRNRLATGGVSTRQLAFHPVKWQQVLSAFSTAAQWLLLGKVRLDLRALAFIIQAIFLTGFAVYAVRTGEPLDIGAEARTKVSPLLAIFTSIYVAFLVLTITFFESDNTLDSRALLPVHFAMLVLAPGFAAALYRRARRSGSIRIVLVLLTLLLAGSYALRGARWLGRTQAGAQGYAGRQWKESALIAKIEILPSGIPIYSNGVDAIYYLTGRRAFVIPAKIIRSTGRPNPLYEADLQKMSDDMRRYHGVMVYFNTLSERWYLPLESELTSRLPLTELLTAPDGSIYKPNPTARAINRAVGIHHSRATGLLGPKSATLCFSFASFRGSYL